MKRKRAKEGDKLYIINVKVDLDNSPMMHFGKNNPKIVQSGNIPSVDVAILGDQSLCCFAEMISWAFDFYFDHPFGFFDNIKNVFKSNEKYELFADIKDIEVEPEVKSVKKNKISQVFDKKGKTLKYLFDYGDNWEFFVKLKSIKEPEKDLAYPVLENYLKEELEIEQYPCF